MEEIEFTPRQIAVADQLHAEVLGVARRGVKRMIASDPSAVDHNYPELARELRATLEKALPDTDTYFTREPTEMETEIINEYFGCVLYLLSPKGAFGETKLPQSKTVVKVLGWTLDPDPHVQIAHLENWLMQCTARVGCFKADLDRASTSEERLTIFGRDLPRPPSSSFSEFFGDYSN